jgi:hypothetical protein
MAVLQAGEHTWSGDNLKKTFLEKSCAATRQAIRIALSE